MHAIVAANSASSRQLPGSYLQVVAQALELPDDQLVNGHARLYQDGVPVLEGGVFHLRQATYDFASM
jgi:hypothetical protein